MEKDQVHKEKRARAANYTQDEMALLLNLAAQFKKIVENKKTDQITWIEKAEAWKKIEAIFNSSSPNGVFRSADSLKKHYENKKSLVKKDIADEKLNILKTGGGAYIPKQDPLRDLTLSIINDKTVYGHSNRFDSDFTQLKPVNTALASNNDVELITVLYDDEADKSLISEPETNFSNKMLNMDVENNTQNWKKCTPDMLKSPLDKALSRKINSCKVASGPALGTAQAKPEELEQDKNTSQTSSWTSRRRPVANVLQGLQSSHLANQYSELAKVKLELAKTQLEMLKEEQASKNIENELRQRILRVELEIKERELEN